MVHKNSSVVSNVYAKFELLNIIKMIKKLQLKKGDFVRTKMTNYPSLIGGLLMVDGVEETQVYVHHIPRNEIGSFARLKSKLGKLSCIKLQVSVEDLDHLIVKRPSLFSRKATKKWQDAIDSHYDVAVFYNVNVKEAVIVTNPVFWNPYSVCVIQPKKKVVAIKWDNIYIL